jgi:MerR family copper efflux transcriptional regulator
VRITEAARRLGTSPRMLRYREDLGLLPPAREDAEGPYGDPARRRRKGRRPRGPGHRQFSEEDLEVAAAVLELERRLRVSPASLAFGLRVLTEPAVRAAVADLGRRTGRFPERPARALDFEKERALRMLGAGQSARGRGSR